MLGAVTGVILLVLIVLLVVIALWWIATYNRLVALREQIRNSWSQIDVQLKRRHDLIPNLVETVKGYLQHERGTLEAVTQARAAALSAGSMPERLQAEGTLSGALRGLMIAVEAYPDLKASANFIQLQEELTGTENKIAFARQHYNDVVAVYNALRLSFPASIVATSGGFAPEEYFELDVPAERNVPRVQF
ncbi:MAG TPA: LemA family protein [Armatimonadota bacterium]|nr:LemA family protein [Armatimonadota bacterium]HOS42149.1 LemA family protein [Armatimonadota bacterium]